MNVTLPLDGSLLPRREREWAGWLARPHENPLSTRADFASGEVVLENDLCVYTQDARYADGLPYSGLIVTRRPCETVFDLTLQEAAAVHALLAEVRDLLESRGVEVLWPPFPSGSAMMIWTTAATSGGVQYQFLVRPGGEGGGSA